MRYVKGKKFKTIETFCKSYLQTEIVSFTLYGKFLYKGENE